MYPMIEHPEVSWALRTGYPSWMQSQDLDVDDDDYEDEELEDYYDE